MLPIPDSRVFRSRKGALWWSFWVLVATVMSVGFGDPAPTANATEANASAPTDALGEPVTDKDLQALAAAFNAN